MKFLIVTHVRHKRYNGNIYGYGPYVREMNLWLRHVDEAIIVAPIEEKKPDSIDLSYRHEKLTFVPVPAFSLTGISEIFKTVLSLPLISWRIYRQMRQADHIHLRCPGNMGLLGSILQIAFPQKKKTAKYAGNWDPNEKQVWSYELQRKILSNTKLTKNTKVLVYGQWPDQTSNIVPFFTATYFEHEKRPVSKSLKEPIRLLFVGTLTKRKNPFFAIRIAEELHKKGYHVKLDIFGEGPERSRLEQYISDNDLEQIVILHGNKPRENLIEFFRMAHFLIFLTYVPEGWPKVVAESMFWGCVPIVSRVSCTPYMLGNGERGKLLDRQSDLNEQMVLDTIESCIMYTETYHEMSQKAMVWSRQFTLDKFENEIRNFLRDEK